MPQQLPTTTVTICLLIGYRALPSRAARQPDTPAGLCAAHLTCRNLSMIRAIFPRSACFLAQDKPPRHSSPLTTAPRKLSTVPHRCHRQTRARPHCHAVRHGSFPTKRTDAINEEKSNKFQRARPCSGSLDTAITLKSLVPVSTCHPLS
ncbi:hypothetical protein IF2G_09555 [Cordyceps javanica]|nr:hypothetical protein IF2G_09555 [Cordyceps javanica]